MFGVKDPYNATESYDEHLFAHNVWQPCSDLNDRIADCLDVPLGPCRKAYDSIVRQSRWRNRHWNVDVHPLIAFIACMYVWKHMYSASVGTATSEAVWDMVCATHSDIHQTVFGAKPSRTLCKSHIGRLEWYILNEYDLELPGSKC